MADNNNNQNDDGGFSYPGYDSSGDERSVTSSVAASVDEETDRHPWRRTAGATAAAAAATNTYGDQNEEDASTLDDGNGPWIYAEPRDNEDGEYSLAGTAVSSLEVTSYARTAEEQSVMSQSYSMMSSHQQLERHQEHGEEQEDKQQQGQEEYEDSYAQPPSDQALNSADNTATRGAYDDPSVGSSHANSFFRGITRRVSEIMSIDESEPTAAGSASATLQAQEMEDEPEAKDQQDYVDMEEEEMEDQVPSPSTSAHSLHSRSSADILKSELDDAINQWESTAKLDVADDGQREDSNSNTSKSESRYSSSSYKKSKRGSNSTAAGSSSSSSGAAATSIRNLSGMLAERSSARLKKASATATKRRAASAGGTSSRSGSVSHGSGSRSASPSPPASRSVSPPAQSKYEDYTVTSNSSAAAAASNVNAAAAVTKDNASATRASFHDSLSTTNTADLIGENANSVLLTAGAPSAATFISAARSAAHTDLNENIKERQREIELELARERRLRLQEELEQEQDQGQDQDQEDSYNHYDEYGDEVYDDEASRARRSSMRGEDPSTSTYGSGFPDMPPPPSEAATDSNRSALREEGMGKKKVSFHTIVSMSTGSGDASSKKLQDAQPTHQELNQSQTQGQQDDSGRFSYSEDMNDDDVLAKAKAGARRTASSRNVQIGAVAVGPDGAENSTNSNLSNYQEQYLNKQQQFMSKVESSGHVVHAASASRTGNPPSLVESSKSLDYASSVQSSATPCAYRSETNTDSRIHRKISANGGPTTAEGGYDEAGTDSRIKKKIAANGGSTSRVVAEVGRSEDGPLDRAVNRSVNRSVRKKIAAMGINDMNAEVGVEEDDNYHPQGHQGGGSDESFAVRKSRAGRMTTVSGPGAHQMGGGPGKYGPHSGGKVTAEMGIEDDEEEGNGYYGRPGLDQMGPLMDASSRWMDGGADHLRKDSPPAAVCGFRRTAVLATILVAVTIGMIALYVPMGPAHILPFGQDNG